MECIAGGIFFGWFFLVLYGAPAIADHYDVMTGARGYNVGNTWHTPAFIFGTFFIMMFLIWLLSLISF